MTDTTTWAPTGIGDVLTAASIGLYNRGGTFRLIDVKQSVANRFTEYLEHAFQWADWNFGISRADVDTDIAVPIDDAIGKIDAVAETQKRRLALGRTVALLDTDAQHPNVHYDAPDMAIWLVNELVGNWDYLNEEPPERLKFIFEIIAEFHPAPTIPDPTVEIVVPVGAETVVKPLPDATDEEILAAVVHMDEKLAAIDDAHRTALRDWPDFATRVDTRGRYEPWKGDPVAVARTYDDLDPF